jgi:TonB family protein
MATLFIYIIKSALCLAAFYLFYKLLLSYDTLHRFNRIVLLLILGLSAVMPFVSYNIHHEKGVEVMADITVGQPSGSLITNEAYSNSAPTWADYLLLVYLAGLLFFVMKNIISLIRMKKFIDRCEKKRMEDGTCIYLSESEIGPFSWMNKIYMSYEDWKNNNEPIISHEKAHIAYRHSIDLIFAQLFVILQWFNPASWLLKREIQAVHEYQADATVIRKGISMQSYQELIIEKAIGTKLCTLANNLNNCSTKKRIIMMIKKPTGPWAKLKLLYVIPVSMLFVLTFASTKASALTSQMLNVSVSNLFPTQTEEEPISTVAEKMPQTQEESIFTVVEKMPKFKGGDAELNTFLMKNVRYPDTCRKANIQGRVHVQFIVEKDGAISNVEVVKSVNEFLDNEAKRVVSMMPKWTPGYQHGAPVRVKYTIPINFNLDSGEESAPFQVVEQMPSFPGGMEKLNEYLKTNLQYPENCKKENIQGRVFVQFIVERDGTISSARIVKSVNKDLDNEAIRVIKSMPKWTPGLQRGVAVRVNYTVPVNFSLN